MTVTTRRLYKRLTRFQSFVIARAPSEDFPYTNCLGVHRSDFSTELTHVLINDTFPLTIRHVKRCKIFAPSHPDTVRYDNDGELEPGCVGVSLALRQWMGISEGTRVTVISLPHPEATLPIQEVQLELDFLKRGYQNSEPYLADDMIMNFTNKYKGILMTDHEPILFKYRGEKLKGKITSILVGLPGSPTLIRGLTGIIDETTRIIFVNAQDSAIRIIPSVKRFVLFILTDIVLLISLSQGHFLGIVFPNFHSRIHRHWWP